MRIWPALFISSLTVAGAVALAADAPSRFNDISNDDLQALRKDLPALFQDGADLPVFDEALRRLVKTGRYENVYVEEKNGVLFLTGRPLRTVEDIRFAGADEGDESDMRDLAEFKAGDRFDRKKAVTLGEKIKEYYGNRGFYNAVVEIDFQKAENQNIIVRYNILENLPCRIAGVAFLTPNTDLKAGLESHFRKLIRKNLTTERVNKLLADLNEYLIAKGYLATELSGPEVKYNKDKTQALVELEIKEPYRWEFYSEAFENETRPDRTVYQESPPALRSALDLRNRERKNLDPATEGAERLRRYYLSRGFPNVQIQTQVVNPEGTYLKRVHYDISEGAKVKINRIEVQGRISRASRYYQDFVLKNSSPLVSKRFYNRADLENGFKNLVTELRNQGFLRAKVLSSRIEYNDKRDQVTVTMLLEEGPQTQIRALDFEGNKFFSSFELAQVTELQTNSPLKLNNFEDSIEKLKNFYRNQGFLEMRLLNEGEELIQYNETGSQARILFRLFEGPRIRVNAIVVEGNTFTKSRVILKEADFKIGEVLTPQKIEDATARLNKMGLFSRADIRTLEEGTNVAERTLVISVADRDPGLFRFGAGVNNERKFTVRGFTGLSYNNLYGTGRGISGRVEVKSNVAQIDYLENEVSAGYLEPFIFRTRTRGRVNLTRSERVFGEYQPDIDGLRILESNRVDFLAERDLTQHTKFTWKVWSLDWRREFERHGRCIPENINDPIPNDDGKCPATRQQVALIGPSVDIDYRDNPFLPTRGSFTRLIADYSHPDIGSTDNPRIEFARLDSNYTYYLRLGSPQYVWVNSVRGGYVSNLSDKPNSGVPTSYAFFLGGIYTVRGFDVASDTDRIPHQDADQTFSNPADRFEVKKQTQILIHTDSHYYLLKSELRFPLVGEHGGVVFYDGGAVHISGYHFEHTYRHAVGFGYRYNTPVGPVALDLAFKIQPLKDESPYRVHLSIGTF